MLKELMDRIYDTLMENVGFSEYHVKFNPEEVENQYVDAKKGFMYFEFEGKVYKLELKETEKEVLAQ